MSRALHGFTLLVSIALSAAETPELPPCPTNIQFFPQTLPMHCRMVFPGKSTDVPPPNMPTVTFPPSFFQSPPPDKVKTMPFPVPPPYPLPFPGSGPMPMPIPLPLPAPPPPQKLPVIVMPFYSPDPAYKGKEGPNGDRGRRPPPSGSDTDTSTDDSSDTDTDTDTDTDASSDSDTWRRNFRRSLRKHKRRLGRHHQKHARRDLLTPIIQYVTKDGYVIYEKEISKNEAKDWLSNNEERDRNKITFAELDDLNRENPGDGTVVDEMEDKASKEATTRRAEVMKKRERKSRKNMMKPPVSNRKSFASVLTH